MTLRPRRVLITGAAGNLGAKLRRHLEGRYELQLLDRNAGSREESGDSTIRAADLAEWDEAWVRQFEGCDAVVHLAADPVAHRTWQELLGPNLDAVANAYEAAARAGVRRFVFASSNHVMGGYQHLPNAASGLAATTPENTAPSGSAATTPGDTAPITETMPPLCGTHYEHEGARRDSTPYAAAKLFGERLGRTYAAARGMEVIAVRIGWVWRGENRPQDLPAERGSWFRQMWLSNGDFCRLMECCLTAELPEKFVVVNGMSNNTGSRWSQEGARRLGYEPQDDVEAG
jgi:uronate dehydrogenase